MKAAHVYVIEDDEGFIKIGASKDMEKRLALKDALEEAATAEARPVSSLVRRILSEWLSTQKRRGRS